MLLLTWVLLVGDLAQPVPTRNVTVVLSEQGAKLAVASAKVVAVSDGNSELAVPVPQPESMSQEGLEVHFDLPVDTKWRVSCETDDLWCPDIEIPAGESNLRLELPITKRALLQGKIQVTHPAELPETLQVQGWGYLPENSRPLSFNLSAPVEDGRYEFSVPAVLLDLRLTGTEFSPIYLWDLAMQDKAVLDLGTTKVKADNSLCGFVQDETSGLPLELAEVVLRFPFRSIGSPTKSNKRLGRMTWTTQTNERGFYQIVGPPVGNYWLEVKSADPEHQLLVVESVGILADSETCLEDLAVKRAIEVSFTISPMLDPIAEPWQVEVNPNGLEGFVEPASAIQLDDAGRAKFRVSPGLHNLTVSSARTGLKILRRPFVLEFSTDIPVTLDLIRVEGSVRLGEEPLIALIDLHDAATTKFESDYKGFFSGWMLAPPNKRLIVEVSAAYPAFSRWLELDSLKIEDEVLQLDLVFEDRSLEGHVTDEKGNPVRLAEVTAVPVGSRMPIEATTDADGSFRLIGLAEKPYLVRARARHTGTSEQVQVEPWGDGPGPQLTFVLCSGRPVRGQLTTAELVPVPGARVVVHAVGGNTGRISASTGMDGGFEVRALEEARRAVAQVFAASHVHWTGCVDLPQDGAKLKLRLPQLPGGRIFVRVPSTERIWPERQLVLISADGGYFTSAQVHNWGYPRGSHNVNVGSQEEGWTFEFPYLASGLYAVVLTLGMDLTAQSCGGAFRAADWQYLSPGGELHLTAGSSVTPAKSASP